MAEQKEQTMEEYLLSQLAEPVTLKDGTIATNPNGEPMTKQQAIATSILNSAMKGDIKAATYLNNLQARAALNKKRNK